MAVRQLPPLLPAGPRERSIPAAAAYFDASVSRAPRRRRDTVSACEACRKRKSKCNAERPRCSRCELLDTECEYQANATETHAQALRRRFSDLKGMKTAYEQVFQLLQSCPSPESQDIYLRIRQGAKADEILHAIQDGNLLLRLSSDPEPAAETSETGDVDRLVD